MNCAGCQRRFEIGDQYIEDTPAAFMGKPDDAASSILADIFGSQGKIAYCEDCTQDGGHWRSETYYGDEDA